LAAEPAQICIADIIHAVDEPIKTTSCREGSIRSCSGTAGRCLTHDLWAELGRHIHLYLSAVTLADVVGRRVLGSAGLFAPAARRDQSQPDAQEARPS
jgi:Rrf2 family iron-sulfur cluster assembly transcriptional regulator